MGNSQTLLGNDFFDHRQWDKEASCYDVMNSMEAEGTERELDLFDISDSDTVLDIGCGPGRMTIPIAKRAREVIAIDSSQAMIDICKRNTEEAGISNARCLRLDWERAEDYELLPQVDVIIQARWSGGASPLEKYRKICRKYVIFIEWEKNPPRIIRNLLFDGCFSEQAMKEYPELRHFDESAYTGQNETKRLKEQRDQNLRDELKAENIEIRKEILKEGLIYRALEREDMVSKIKRLSPHPELVDPDKLEENIRQYVEKEGDGWKFYLPTWSRIEWFSLSGK